MSFSRGIDLSGLASSGPSGDAAGAASATGGGSWVINATEQDFQREVLEASVQHLVVLALWSPRAERAQEFNDVLVRVTNSLGGQILLALVDVDANPQIAQAVGAAGVPMGLGLVKGQPVPLFNSTLPEDDVRRLFEELIRVGVQNGVSGRATARPPLGGQADEVAEEPAEDPRFAAADEAFASGDLSGAIAEYEKLRDQYPADTEVAERLAGVRLMHRTADADLQAAREAAAQAPDDIDAQLLVADLDVSGGHVEDAFDRLISLIRRVFGDDRERVRERLLELFTVVGADDPRVATARRNLASALF